MIRIIPLLLSFLLFFSVTELHASAAEKWEYEPVMKDMNIHVKGYKVDQYGNAVNDYEYNTKIDPKTSSNKTKMGTVGMGRLLKTSGWGLLGSVALEALLEAVDWVIDPEAQSIWRNKKSDTPSYEVCFDGRYLFRAQDGSWEKCPDTAIKKFWESVSSSSVKYEFHSFQVSPKDVLIDKKGTQIYYTVTANRDGAVTTHPNQTLSYKTDPDYVPTPQEKEYLTPEALADYANKTHSDYAKPELAEKLNPKYSPDIASDLWKPSNPWEEVNSPTVQEVQRKLDQAQPEPKKDAEIKPNPETGGSVLPKFCDWAASICDFIDWVKQPPETPEPIEVPEKELEQKEIKKDLITANVRSCPADIHFDVQNLPFGIQVNKGVQMQPICDTIEPLKYVFQLFTLVLCGFILLRV